MESELEFTRYRVEGEDITDFDDAEYSGCGGNYAQEAAEHYAENYYGDFITWPIKMEVFAGEVIEVYEIDVITSPTYIAEPIQEQEA